MINFWRKPAHRRCKNCKDPICKACLYGQRDISVDEAIEAHEEDDECQEPGHPERCIKVLNGRKHRRGVHGLMAACDQLQCEHCYVIAINKILRC